MAAYVTQEWVDEDGSGNGTLFTAARMGHMEEGIAAAQATADEASVAVQDEGTVLPRRSAINFTGAGVTASDDATNDRVNVEIDATGGSGGGGGTDATKLGEVRTWTRATIPADCLLADGASYTQVAYPELYGVAAAEAAAGNTLWTADTAAQTFTVPDLRDRFIYGKGAKALGTRGGEENTTLTEAQMPSHIHTLGGVAGRRVHSPDANDGTGAGGSPGWSALSLDPAGGDESHNNMPPYVVLAFIVQAKPTGGGNPSASEADAPNIATLTNASTYTFTGLNGDADEAYEVIVLGKTTSGSVYVRPNGDAAANYWQVGSHAYTGMTTPAAGSVTNGTGIALNAVDTGLGPTLGRVLLLTKSGTKRVALVDSAVRQGGYVQRDALAVSWENSTDNITSLRIDFTQAFTGTVMLRKVLSPTTLMGGLEGGVPGAADVTPTALTRVAPWLGGTNNAAFYQRVGGVVRLAGVVTNTASFSDAGVNSLIATLPPGFRPTQEASYAVQAYDPTAGWLTGLLRVKVDGSIVAYAGFQSGAAGTMLDLGSVAFTVSSPAAANGPRIVRGSINADGTIRSGTGFTVTKGVTGTYTIDFDTEFAQAPAIDLTPWTISGVTYGNASIDSTAPPTVSGFRVVTSKSEAVTATDLAFDFVAIDTSGAAVESYTAPQRVTALPTTAVDQQEIYYQPDPVNNPSVVWHLQYNAAAAKWDGIGGNPLVAESGANYIITSVGSWAATGLSLMVPVAGTYDIEVQACTNVGTPNWVYVAVGGAAGGVNAALGVRAWNDSSSLARTMRRVLTAAALSLYAYKDLNASAAIFDTRISIRPVRIG